MAIAPRAAARQNRILVAHHKPRTGDSPEHGPTVKTTIANGHTSDPDISRLDWFAGEMWKGLSLDVLIFQRLTAELPMFTYRQRFFGSQPSWTSCPLTLKAIAPATVKFAVRNGCGHILDDVAPQSSKKPERC